MHIATEIASALLANNPNRRNCIVTLLSEYGNILPSLQRWLPSYGQGGMAELLSHKPRSGRPRIITPKTLDRLEKELQEPEGFSSYKEVHQWLTSYCEVEVSYRTVHQWARYSASE